MYNMKMAIFSESLVKMLTMVKFEGSFLSLSSFLSLCSFLPFPLLPLSSFLPFPLLPLSSFLPSLSFPLLLPSLPSPSPLLLPPPLLSGSWRGREGSWRDRRRRSSQTSRRWPKLDRWYAVTCLNRSLEGRED